VSRLAIAAVVVAFASVAHADLPKAPKPEAPKTEAPNSEPPDEIADVESREANLESNERRKGFTIALAIGGDIMLGGDIGVGRGPWVSLRLGHVATRKTVITFELISTNGLHKEAEMDSPTLTDNNFGLFAGAQRYTSRTFWVRAAGGLSVLVTDVVFADQTGGNKPIPGVGGLVGGGLDIARLGRYIPVIGLEGFGMASVSRNGVNVQLALGLGFAYY
jgi:hypothetical protein